MLERTEQEAVSMAPLTLRFGAVDYAIPLLRIGAAQQWREKMIKDLGGVLINFEVPTGTTAPVALGLGLQAALVRTPLVVLGLICSYAPSLPRETIEADATDEQITVAFDKIKQVAFPHMEHLKTARELISLAVSQLQ